MENILSICILTYNRAKLLQQCLESLLSQVKLDAEIEVLVSDNASTDNTNFAVKEIQKSYPDLKYYCNNENIGFDGNVVACITRATGKYIFFMSDDDILLPGTVHKVQEYIKSYNPSCLSVGHYSFLKDDCSVRGKIFYPSQDKIYESGMEFFDFAGLGFISGLVLRLEYAKQFIIDVRMGKGCAHLEIASRICLKKNGPFIFVGEPQVAARAPETFNYDLLVYGYINVFEVYKKLVEEGFLDKQIFVDKTRANLTSGVPKYILNQIVTGDYNRVYSQRKLVEAAYKDFWQFYVYCYPLYHIPRLLLIYPYRILHSLVLKWRKNRLNKNRLLYGVVA